MSNVETAHRGKNGLFYESYTAMVAANISYRDEILKAKGLDKASFAALSKSSKPKTTKKKQRKVLAAPSPTPRRISARIRNSPPSNEGLEILQEEHFVAKPKRRKPIKQNLENKPLTEKERDILNVARKDWLEDMEAYLKEEEQLSHQNHRSVMRQVEKLVTGQGITYHHWKEGVYFYKNQCVRLSSDFEAMHKEACAFEDEHGKDLGNGWLMRHPITKLRNFQKYYLEKKKTDQGETT